MNDELFRQRLRGWTVPSPSQAAREQARHRTMLAFQQGGEIETKAGRHPLAWRLGYTVLILAVLAAAWWWLLPRPARENLAADRELIRQMDKLFPGQIDAIIEKDGKVDLVIAQGAVIGSDQPVVLVFRHGDETIRVLSYSGHRLCLSLGGQRNCLEILATPSGGVILEDEGRAWLATDHPVIDGYRVQTHALRTL